MSTRLPPHLTSALTRARRFAALAGLLLLISVPFFSSPLRASSPVRQADDEAALLHRRLDLSTLTRYHRAQKSWQPLRLPPARLYVVNLWGVHCAPCRAEFPLLRNVARAWQAQKDVVFLYVADPPLDSPAEEVVRFWQELGAQLPDADPLRSRDDGLRATLDNPAQPITLLLDSQLVVRQAFVGAIGDRPLGTAITRLLRVLPPQTTAGGR